MPGGPLLFFVTNSSTMRIINQNQIIMTRQERKLLIKKVKRQYWIATGLLLFVILFFVVLFTTPLIELFYAPEGTELTDAQMLIRVGLFNVFTVVPMFIALRFNFHAGWNQRALYTVRRGMYEKKNRMYTEWLIDAVKNGDYKKAKHIHNELIWGETKTLTRGILLGVLYHFGDNEDRKIAEKHFNEIPEEIYKQK